MDVANPRWRPLNQTRNTFISATIRPQCLWVAGPRKHGVVVVISLLSYIQAETYVISYKRPVIGRHLWFTTYPYVGQYSHESSPVAWPQKHRYSRWNFTVDDDDDKFISVTQVSSRTSNAPPTTVKQTKMFWVYVRMHTQLSGSRSSDGRLFQILGPQIAKARELNEIVLVRGMNSSRFDVDRSCLRPGTDWQFASTKSELTPKVHYVHTTLVRKLMNAQLTFSHKIVLLFISRWSMSQVFVCYVYIVYTNTFRTPYTRVFTPSVVSVNWNTTAAHLTYVINCPNETLTTEVLNRLLGSWVFNRSVNPKPVA